MHFRIENQQMYSSISACRTNILSWVKYPLLKPVWFSEIIPSSLEKILSLFKHSPPFFVKIYCKLFNIVLNTGIIPENWTCGVIKPIFKNKGCPTDPDM
jgi:hypothetical protein